MSNSSTTASSNSLTTITSNTTGYAQGIGPCTLHGTNNCSCRNTALVGQQLCPTCGQYYGNYNSHSCSSIYGGLYGGFAFCISCSQGYTTSAPHICQPHQTTWTTTTNTTPSWMPIYPKFKEVKEITTDSELIYEWNGSTFNMKLPAKFGDCFLKVGYSWSPLYPLIFSALENEAKEISFHLVVGIADKKFEDDSVILNSVTTTKIEDNLTLLQLCSRTKEYFKDDASR